MFNGTHMKEKKKWLHWCILTACPTGKFGYDCRYDCGNCYLNHACNHVNGICANGCNEEFKGELCKTRKSNMFQIIGILLFIVLDYRVIILLILPRLHG